MKGYATILVNGQNSFNSGFSTVLLVEDVTTRKKYAIKKIICHGPEDQQLAMKEVEYYKLIKHLNIIECVDFVCKDIADSVVNTMSQVLIVLPYYHVNLFAIFLEKIGLSLT